MHLTISMLYFAICASLPIIHRQNCYRKKKKKKQSPLTMPTSAATAQRGSSESPRIDKSTSKLRPIRKLSSVLLAQKRSSTAKLSKEAMTRSSAQCSVTAFGCQEWLHRQCAGLSRSAFQVAAKSKVKHMHHSSAPAAYIDMAQ